MRAALSTRDLLAALCVVLVWGTNFVAMKIGLRELTPFQLGAGRYLFALLPLVLFIRPPRLAWQWLLLYGLCQGVGQFGLLFLSLRAGMSASLASVLLQTQVFFTALLGVVLLREQVNRALQAGMLLAAAGLACFAINYFTAAGDVSLAGLLLCLAGAAMWAASNIVVRLARQAAPAFDVLGFMVWSSLVPIVPFCLLSLCFDPAAARSWLAHLSWHTWAALANLGWLSTILAYALWTGLLKRHPANRIAPFSLGVPVIGIGAGMVLLGDRITGWQWAGIVFIVLALVVVVLGPGLAARRRPPGTVEELPVE